MNSKSHDAPALASPSSPSLAAALSDRARTSPRARRTLSNRATDARVRARARTPPSPRASRRSVPIRTLDNEFDDDDDDDARAPTRREVARYGLLALTLPLWRDLIHDLGFFEGEDDLPAELPTPGPGQREAEFAGGCFWCMEAPFDGVDGVLATTSGYVGGTVERPRYRDVGSGATGHVESVRVLYDASKTSYEELLRVYWRQIDATRDDGQFVDAGEQYRPVIWALDEAQREAAEKSKAEIERSNIFGAPIKVEVVDASKMTFWPAERYHQNYYVNNRNRYQFYRMVSGRDEYIASVWGEERSG